MTPKKIPFTLSDSGSKLRIDESVYSLDCVQRAALKFTDLASINISRIPDSHHLEISIERFPDAGVDVEQLAQLLCNEVLDQSLRERIRQETETERTLILSYTFSRSSLVQG
ncbi:MAG: His-Xaa-Ser system protein HxsD [Halothiobacillus sp.]|jgi:His-Xaa-Ser system protein HxsD|nr:His-Xaa-Ser system protein HxsD [Halothiobacillus sp.]